MDLLARLLLYHDQRAKHVAHFFLVDLREPPSTAISRDLDEVRNSVGDVVLCRESNQSATVLRIGYQRRSIIVNGARGVLTFFAIPPPLAPIRRRFSLPRSISRP